MTASELQKLIQDGDRAEDSDIDITNNSDAVYQLYARKQGSYFVNKFRIENLDRYDDRDVIITNLFESYDRLMSFGAKYLSDPFVMEGIYSVSARDKILREIFSNSLAHRDYSSGYVAKFLIEKDGMYTENANRSHGSGILDLKTFVPLAKNPAISRVFRETTLADELGSGMRNAYKYAKLYSGQYPQFIEGDVFRAVVPLAEVSIGRVGPKFDGAPQDAPHNTPQDTPQDSLHDTPQDSVKEKILYYCAVPRQKADIATHCGYSDVRHFTTRHLKPLLEAGMLLMAIPEKPTSRKQKYIAAPHVAPHVAPQDAPQDTPQDAQQDAPQDPEKPRSKNKKYVPVKN